MENKTFLWDLRDSTFFLPYKMWNQQFIGAGIYVEEELK